MDIGIVKQFAGGDDGSGSQNWLDSARNRRQGGFRFQNAGTAERHGHKKAEGGIAQFLPAFTRRKHEGSSHLNPLLKRRRLVWG